MKQLILIEKKIELFANNKIALFSLIADLSGIMNAFECIPISWKDNFQTELNTLEMISDTIEERVADRWQGDIKEDLQSSILILKNMIMNTLEQYLSNIDPNILESAGQMDSNWLLCPKCNDVWESDSTQAMVICPKCKNAFRNPRYLAKK